MVICRLNTLEKERGKNDKLDSQSSQKLKDTSLSQRTSSQNIENINNNNTSGAKDTENNNNNTVHMDTAEDSWGSELVARNTQTSAEEERASRYLESEGYSTFLYWRDPVADLVDIDLAEQEEELEVVKTELSNLDLESSTDDDGCGNKTAVEKTETEHVSVEESEKEDLPEKGSSKEELDNAAAAESNSAPETDGAVDNKQKIDDNENKTAAVDNETRRTKRLKRKVNFAFGSSN